MRKVKDVVYDYSDIERKVRKATSNKPVRATSTQMKEIADATYDPSQFPQIMGILWKRLNEPGKYWRHVYKGLIVLEYIILNGSDQVALAARENIFAIQTLKDFRMIDSDDRDQGQHVRQLASKIVDLLRDDQRLREQREKYAAARSRVHAGGSGADRYGSGTYGGGSGSGGGGYNAGYDADYDSPRPQRRVDSTTEEEDRQLREVLELSKREAEEEERRRRMREENDPDLQAALALSKVDSMGAPAGGYGSQNAADDLLGFGSDFGSDFGAPAPTTAPFGSDFGGYGYGGGAPAAPAYPAASDPFAMPATSAAPQDLWGTPAPAPFAAPAPAPAPAPAFAAASDPWAVPAAAPAKPAAKLDANRQLAEIARNSSKIDEFSGLRGSSRPAPPAPQFPAPQFPTPQPQSASPSAFGVPPAPAAQQSFGMPQAQQSFAMPPAPQPQAQQSFAPATTSPPPMAQSVAAASNPWDVGPLEAALPKTTAPAANKSSSQAAKTGPASSTPPPKNDLFDKHKNLVNLDSLISGPKTSAGGYSPSNPFGLSSGSSQAKSNPFGGANASAPLNQLRSGSPGMASPMGGMGMGGAPMGGMGMGASPMGGMGMGGAPMGGMGMGGAPMGGMGMGSAPMGGMGMGASPMGGMGMGGAPMGGMGMGASPMGGMGMMPGYGQPQQQQQQRSDFDNQNPFA